MRKCSIPVAGALLVLSFLPLSAQQQKDWRQQPLEYQHSVTLELTTNIPVSSDTNGTPIIVHPIVRRLSSIPNVAELKVAGNLTAGTITVRFGFRTVQAFNEWNDAPATRELIADLEKLSPNVVMVSLVMNAKAIEK